MGSTVRVFCVLIALFASTLCFSANSTPNRPAARDSERTALLDPISSNGARASAFTPIAQAGAQGTCTNFRPPRLVTVIGDALPLLNAKVGLDLVVGIDGYVESFLILDKSDDTIQRKVADHVSRWVYKPALCNGVPVAAEGRIEIHGE